MRSGCWGRATVGPAGRRDCGTGGDLSLFWAVFPVILLTVLEIIITPALAGHDLPYFLDGERLVVGVAMDQPRPAALAGGTRVGPGGGVGLQVPPMPTWATW